MSGEQRFQKTFSRRKNASKPANNVNQKRGKDKHVEVEDQVKAEENANSEEALAVPSSSAESQEGGGDGDEEVARKPIANGGGGSSSASRSATKKRKSDGGSNMGRKQPPKQKTHKEEKQSQQGKQKKQRKDESKMKPKQEGKKQTGKGEKAKQKKQKEKKKKKDEEEEEEASAGCRFPVSRVDRIIRSEGSDYRITNEAVFLISKASERFLEIFCGDSYKCAAHDHKKYVNYNHLATAISKEKKFDFLSDYVPEKLKAEKALAERTPPVEK